MKQVSLGDISLACVDAGDGPPLLFVHGFPLDHSMWDAQLRELAGPYRVIAPDLRGFGQSGVTAGTVPMEQFADDLYALLLALYVDEPIVYCGLSMGGYIGWPFMRKYAKQVRGLVMCDTLAGADPPEAVKNRGMLAEKVLREGPQPVIDAMRPRLFGSHTVAQRSDLVESTLRVMEATQPDGIAAALRGMAQRSDSTSMLASIEAPTLIVVGEEDVISPPAKMREIAAAIPRATYVEVPQAGHMAPLENADYVNRALREFLEHLP